MANQRDDDETVTAHYGSDRDVSGEPVKEPETERLTEHQKAMLYDQIIEACFIAGRLGGGKFGWEVPPMPAGMTREEAWPMIEANINRYISDTITRAREAVSRAPTADVASELDALLQSLRGGIH